MSKALFVKVLAIVEKKVIVDFRSRMLAFRGAGGEPPRLRLRGLTCPAIPAGVDHPSAPINFLSMNPYSKKIKTSFLANNLIEGKERLIV
ncbi:MAG: hypothetical protein ACQEWE_07115 [Bacillota bacterium]